MIRNRLLALACLFSLGGFAAPAQAGLFTFTGSFESVGLNPDIVPGGTQSGSFSFQVDYPGEDGTHFSVPGTLELTLSQSTIGGVDFSVAAGNVVAGVLFRDAVPVRLWVAGAPNGIFLAGAAGQSDFFIRYQVAAVGDPGPLPANQFTATDGSTSTNATGSNLSGTTTYAAVVVPEPSTLAMVGVGAIALVGRRLRRSA
ncbi:MAG: PEP-CTERM sorting domain-containing protein [Isosphaeraceae bacterium]|nr:PEP-CTERM sorting domain-containing protein [Isosphaeraceae bacterium]